MDRAWEAAWRALREHAALSFPIKPSRIAKERGIFLYTYHQYRQATGRPLLQVAVSYGTDGFTQYIHGNYVVFYNPTNPIPRIRWTLAHELGHILMGHFASGYSTPGNPPLDQGEKAWEDVMADRFASQLLCPLPGVFLCGPSSQGELAQLCDLSAQAAGITWGRLEKWESRLPSPEKAARFLTGEGPLPTPAGVDRDLWQVLATAFRPFAGQYRLEREQPAPEVFLPLGGRAYGRL